MLKAVKCCCSRVKRKDWNRLFVEPILLLLIHFLGKMRRYLYFKGTDLPLKNSVGVPHLGKSVG